MTGSLRAYAKHRKESGLAGGSLNAVQKALASGRITKGSDGMISFDRADRDWEKNLNKRKRPAGESSPAQSESDNDNGSFLEAQTRHEWLKVQKEELALQIRRGELLEKTEVEQKWSVLLTTFRNRMLLMVDKLAPRVAVVSELLECRALIQREVNEALSALSEYQPNEA